MINNILTRAVYWCAMGIRQMMDWTLIVCCLYQLQARYVDSQILHWQLHCGSAMDLWIPTCLSFLNFYKLVSSFLLWRDISNPFVGILKLLQNGEYVSLSSSRLRTLTTGHSPYVYTVIKDTSCYYSSGDWSLPGCSMQDSKLMDNSQIDVFCKSLEQLGVLASWEQSAAEHL